MSHQTFQQRRALRAYCAVQRSARCSATNPVASFPTAPGVPGSAPQTLSRLDTRRFWIGLAVVIGVVAGLRIGGVL